MSRRLIENPDFGRDTIAVDDPLADNPRTGMVLHPVVEVSIGLWLLHEDANGRLERSLRNDDNGIQPEFEGRSTLIHLAS